jgi:GNAT superfamily N-acetyltransferase
MSAVEIRPLVDEDRTAWEPLWQAYLTFYERALEAGVTDTTWVRFHEADEPLFALGAFVDGKLVGFATYLFHRSTWSISDRCYLEDLFVAAGARNRGTGRALIEAVATKAKEAGASRLHWLTNETNHTARALYDKVAERSGFIQYRKAL